jgi:hypothetical protein
MPWNQEAPELLLLIPQIWRGQGPANVSERLPKDVTALEKFVCLVPGT